MGAAPKRRAEPAAQRGVPPATSPQLFRGGSRKRGVGGETPRGGERRKAITGVVKNVPCNAFLRAFFDKSP